MDPVNKQEEIDVSFMYLIHGPHGGWRHFDWSGKHVRGATVRSHRKETKDTTT